MRRSMCSSPGNHGSCSGGMVLTYGVRDRGREADLQLRGPGRAGPRGGTGRGSCRGCRRRRPATVQPLPRLGRVDVRELVDEPVEDHASHSRIGCPWNDAADGASPGMADDPVQDHLIVYTDGACSGNPGPGGWAWAVAPSGAPWASGGEARTTNQRMEIQAVLEALRALAGPGRRWSPTRPTSSTASGTAGGRAGCARAGPTPSASRWPTATCGSRWSTLVRAREDEVAFRWVKGHSGDPMNDLVDRLAVEAAATAAVALTAHPAAGRPPPGHLTVLADLAARCGDMRS